MVSIFSLWLPILLSAVGVFIASSIIHMALKYHAKDWSPLPDEDSAMEALRQSGLQPGNYTMPYCASMEEMKSEAFLEKMNKGPVAFLQVAPSGPYAMGKHLAQWFLYSLFIGVFCAYLASRTLEPGAYYLEVFRFVGTVAFGGYALAHIQESIWYRRKWGTTLRNLLDGFIYATVTAGVFGWLWPAG